MPIQWQPRARLNWSPVGRLSRQNYYTRRDCGEVDYSRYWSHAVDPDGRVRNRLSMSEKLTYLDNVAEELEFVQSLPAGKTLDFGCGPGWFLEALGGYWETVGVEIAEDAIEILRMHGTEYYTDIRLAPLCSFDVVLCHHVIEHLEDPITAIGDIRDVLLPDGWLILGTPDFDSPCAKRFGERYRMLHDQTHCSLFTLESMHRFLTDHGFQIRDVRFPFPQRFATAENFARWNEVDQVSPAWPGNWMTFYCQR